MSITAPLRVPFSVDINIIDVERIYFGKHVNLVNTSWS